MPRRARLVIPGMAHHVTQRGNFKQDVFHRQEDFRNYCYWFKKFSQDYKVEVIAYCLMRNHVHFVVIPGCKYSLGLLFKNVHMRYAQYKNKRESRTGHLWQGRFYSCILSRTHLYRAVRYVEQNPVRAKICQKPWDYVWSSAKTHVCQEKQPIITLSREYTMLGGRFRKGARWKEYLLRGDDAVDEEIRIRTYKGLAVGKKAFIEKLEKERGICLNIMRNTKKTSAR